MEKRELREALLYRLNVANLKILTLNEREEDIPILANHLIQKISEK